ncbi:MAG: hypothetical protein D6767_03900 [Candidatus Hydrogenedentota bacterium]|nr:MAG: hypothetical protein D6767_03900 [Candidatus Hydrogenedentota bacterium]
MMIFAHRGGISKAAENTLEAFEHAISLSCDGLETDVQITKDNVAVLSHDEDTLRLTGKKYKIAEISYSDLVNVPIVHDSGKSFVYASLENFCRLILKKNFKGYVNIDIKPKTKNAVQIVLQTLNLFSLPCKIILASFYHRQIQRVRSDSNFATVASPLETRLHYVQSRIGYSFGKPAFQFLEPPLYYKNKIITDEKFIQLARQRNIQVIPWTINSMDEYEYAKTIGLDGIITDYPEKFLA